MEIPDIKEVEFSMLFGLFEFEELAREILIFLKRTDVSSCLVYDTNMGFASCNCYSGWNKQFAQKDFPKYYDVFTMMCAAGWIQNAWFPKGSYIVSKAFIERIKRGIEKKQKNTNADFKNN
jgi:hypothetical protein